MLNLQAKEKGLELIFDVHEKQHANIIESKDYNNEILTLQDSNTRSGKLNEIIVDKDEKGYIPAYLTCNDFINIDPYKMNQVISNIVSNAIKFTPVGQTVTIKARKIIPDQRVTQNFSISNLMYYESSFLFLFFPEIMLKCLDYLHCFFFHDHLNY